MELKFQGNKIKHDKDDVVWVFNTACENWVWLDLWFRASDSNTLYWETEEEIKQVVSALRSVFKGGVKMTNPMPIRIPYFWVWRKYFDRQAL